MSSQYNLAVSKYTFFVVGIKLFLNLHFPPFNACGIGYDFVLHVHNFYGTIISLSMVNNVVPITTCNNNVSL